MDSLSVHVRHCDGCDPAIPREVIAIQVLPSQAEQMAAGLVVTDDNDEFLTVDASLCVLHRDEGCRFPKCRLEAV